MRMGRIKEEPQELPPQAQHRWDVEGIVGRRRGRGGGGGIEYLVIWEGFSAAESTWEPVENLESASEAVEAFEAAQSKKRKQLAGGAAVEGTPAAAAVTPTKRRRADAVNADADADAAAAADPPAEPSAGDACACCMVVPDVEDGTVTPCGHVFCLACITEWLNQHFDVDEIAPQQRCPVCRTGLRQFARQIHITNATTDAPTAVGAPRPAKKRRPIISWSVAEAQQLQALLLAPPVDLLRAAEEGTSAPRRLGERVVESSVEWETIASKLGTGRSGAAVRARARTMGLLVSATAAAAAEAAAAAAAAAAEAKRTPKTPGKQRGGGRPESAAETAYKVLLQRIKPLWRRRAQERRCRRMQLLKQQEQQQTNDSGKTLDPTAAIVPIASAGYDDDEEEEGTDTTGEEQQGAARWQWGGVEGVAPWAEEENSYVKKVLQPSAAEEAEWVVEAVVDKRLVFSGSSPLPQEQWEVKWWKWPCTTWEPREHLEGCAELVERYESALHAAVKYAPFDGTTLRGVRAAMALSRAALAKSIGVKEREVKAWEEGVAEQEEMGQVPIPFSRQHAVLQLYQASWRAARRNAMLRCGGLQLSAPHKQRLSDGKPCRGFSLIGTSSRPGIAAFRCLAQANKPKATKDGGSRRSPEQVAAGLQLPLPLELACTHSRSRKPCPTTLRLGWLLEPPALNQPDRQWDVEWTPPRKKYSAASGLSGSTAGAGAGDGGVVGGSCLASFAQQNGLVAGDVLLVERVEEEEETKEDSLVLRVVVLWSTVDVAAQRARRGGRAAGGKKRAAVVAAATDATV